MDTHQVVMVDSEGGSLHYFTYVRHILFSHFNQEVFLVRAVDFKCGGWWLKSQA
jgi:hypothetical protein